jgi:hypothetical protein
LRPRLSVDDACLIGKIPQCVNALHKALTSSLKLGTVSHFFG